MGLMAHICNPNTPELEAGGSEGHGHPLLQTNTTQYQNVVKLGLTKHIVLLEMQTLKSFSPVVEIVCPLF